MIFSGHGLCPQTDSNRHHPVRSGILYPLSYGGKNFTPPSPMSFGGQARGLTLFKPNKLIFKQTGLINKATPTYHGGELFSSLQVLVWYTFKAVELLKRIFQLMIRGQYYAKDLPAPPVKTVVFAILKIMSSNFYKKVYELVKKIPRGKVVSYGQVAALLGKPRSARLVGWALAKCPTDVPWQRVINRQGMISIENMNAPKELQAELLTKDGVKVLHKENNWWVDLKIYTWKKL